MVEDVHWADSETLDCLTFLSRAGRPGAARVVVTCRNDEAPLDAHVTDWLAPMRGAAEAEEITLGPLSRAAVPEPDRERAAIEVVLDRKDRRESANRRGHPPH